MRSLGLRCVLSAVAAAGLLVLSACGLLPETWQWNQTLTVTVATPEGVRSGSATTQVRWQELNFAGNYPSSYKGEATMVDLGDRGMLFALIGESTKYLAMRTFADDLGKDALIAERGFAAMARLRGTRPVPPKLYPLLVTFTDIDDPTTVRRVDPDDLAASFGPGVTLKRITLEISDEPVTEGEVEKVLGWLAWSREKILKAGGGENPVRMPNDSPRGFETIGRTQFSRGG